MRQLERELKILIDRDRVDLEAAVSRQAIRQVYLQTGAAAIRVRCTEPDDYELTVKFASGARPAPAPAPRRGRAAPAAPPARPEYTLALDPDEGRAMYADARAAGFPEIVKTRYRIPAEGLDPAGLTWELDLFEERFAFLSLVELEYPGPRVPAGIAKRPAWYSGRWKADVSTHGGFANARLVQLDAPGLARLRRELEGLLAATTRAARRRP